MPYFLRRGIYNKVDDWDLSPNKPTSGTFEVTAQIVLAISLLLAHHSTANYDTSRVVKMKGVVTSVDWRNPHVRIHLDVTEAEGRAANWDVETWGTGQLSLRGFTNGFLKPRDKVSAEVYIAKDGTRTAVVHRLTLPDGQTMDGPPVDFTQ